MDTYILLDDLMEDLEGYLKRTESGDERFVIQSRGGETLGVLVSQKFVDGLEKLSKHMKVKLVS